VLLGGVGSTELLRQMFNRVGAGGGLGVASFEESR
jgi:hypothetical protein